ncbi:MAG: site-2 protease family protein [Clostridia bacterium]|nr:site-2 protease family protein [Clostridia bacterium]
MLLDILFDGTENLMANVLALLVVIPCLLFSLSVHEYAHGFAAYKQGDGFAKLSGRLTINPLKHIDPLGFACMLLVGFGWAKPVPVVPANFKNGRKSMIIVSVAGVVANMLLAFVFAFLWYFLCFIVFPNVSWFFESERGILLFTVINMIFGNLISVNVTLAVFNLVPIPPLDGYKLLKELAIGKINYNFFTTMERHSTIILLAFLFLSNRIGIIAGLSGLFLDAITSVMDLIFVAFI